MVLKSTVLASYSKFSFIVFTPWNTLAGIDLLLLIETSVQ